MLGKNPIEFDLRLHDGATFGHIREYTMTEVVNILQNENFEVFEKCYFSIDAKRNIFTQLESKISILFHFLGNNLMLIAKKV